MVVSFQKIAFGCIFLLTIQQVALALTCYSCNLCDSVSSSTATDTGDYCVKATGSVAGVTAVYRYASAACTEGSDTFGSVSVTNHCCTTDKCNSGHALSSSFRSAMILAGLVFAFKWMMNN